MNTKRNTVSWGSFLGWLIATFLAVVIGFAVFFVVMSMLGESNGVIPDLVASLLMAGCFGLVIGLAQWTILRRYLQRSAAWIGVTFLGFLISSPVLLSMSGGFGPYITLQASLIMAASLGGSLGVTQWFVMHRKVGQSALWIGISLVSWILAGLIGVFLKTLSWEAGPLLYWLGLFFTGTVLSVIGMLWLVKRPNLPANSMPAV